MRSAEADARRAEAVRAAGMSTDADVLSIRVHLATRREQQIRRRAELDVAWATLNEALGLPLAEWHQLTTSLTPARPPELPVEDYERHSLEQRPEVRQARLGAGLAETQAAAARAALWPQVVAHAGFEADQQRPAARGGANWLASLSLRWNLFNGFEDRSRIREAAEMLNQAQARQAQASAQINLQVRKAHADFRAARAQLELAEVTFRRTKDLFDKRSISNQEFDEASARLKVAQASHEMAQAKRTQLASKIAQAEAARRAAEVMRGYGQITAPFDGGVTEKSAQTGSLAAPGAPLLTLERQDDYRLEAAVEESKLAEIRLGQSAEVVLDALGRTLRGRVAEVVPAVDAASRTFTVKIDLPALPQLRSGMFGRARFQLGRRKVLLVPAAAVTERGQLFSLFVVEEGRARNRLVTVGQRLGAQLEVLSGLNAGERIIHPAPAGLVDGAKVEARP